MVPHVLLCKRTGNILEAYRITFMDDPDAQDISDGEHGIPIPFTAHTYKVCLVEHHGWIASNPESGTALWFFINMFGSGYFEDLGEL